MVYFRRTALPPANAKLIKSLQKACLPYDRPYMNTQAWYWIGYHGPTPVAFCILAPSVQ